MHRVELSHRLTYQKPQTVIFSLYFSCTFFCCKTSLLILLFNQKKKFKMCWMLKGNGKKTQISPMTTSYLLNLHGLSLFFNFLKSFICGLQYFSWFDQMIFCISCSHDVRGTFQPGNFVKIELDMNTILFIMTANGALVGILLI